ncbi:MAG: Asp23/Gls24 family envelope stress response protein [Oscillospiraceae bacterium]|nr:Asp23/Gls24 family envelope stress response protein [Oscillospiraceae bacterium]
MIKLYTDLGYISVSNDVLTDLTGQAAMSCFGVKGMTVLSMTDGLVHLLKREAMGKGVKVIYNNDGTVSLELHIAVDDGVNIPVLCGNVMNEVRYKMETVTGVSVKKVDVFVDSVIAG